VARAIVRAAREKRLVIPQATGFTSMTGRGIRATVNGKNVQVGRILGAVSLEDAIRPESRQEILPADKDK
jgi:Cu2+-exporting ATPase